MILNKVISVKSKQNKQPLYSVIDNLSIEDSLNEIITSRSKDYMTTLLKDVTAAEKLMKPYKKKKIVVIFGSARLKPDSQEYKDVVDLAYKLASKGYGILSGGGPGLMEAANKGAYLWNQEHPEKKVPNIGFNLILPHEQQLNPYVEAGMTFERFSTRIHYFRTFGSAFVISPGGWGTDEETTSILCHTQNGKVPLTPIIVQTEQSHNGMFDKERIQQLIKEGRIASDDPKIFTEIQDIRDSFDHIDNFYRNIKRIRYDHENISKEIKLYITNKVDTTLVHSVLSKYKIDEFDFDVEINGQIKITIHNYPARAFGRLRSAIDEINNLPRYQ